MPLPASPARRPLAPSTLLLGLLFALAAGCASVPMRSPERVQTDVEAMARALYAGDVDTVIGFTHPAVLAKLGGVAIAHAAVESAVKQMQQNGTRLESFQFPKPPEFLQVGERWFATVPTLSVIVVGNQRVESLNFQFGVLEPGADGWSYIEGSRVQATDVPLLFPGFPTGHRFPPFYRRKL